MWKWLIGPALLGTGCVAGSVYGRDAEQLAHKSPSVTYAGFEQALDNVPQSGMTSFENATPTPYELKVDRTLDQQLVVTVLFSGRQGAAATFDFSGKDGGKATLVTAKVHGDRQVLSSALAGTSRARLAYAPDWMLNLAARPLLAQVAAQVERGESARIMTEGEAEAQWEQNLSEEQRGQLQQWRQYDATQPTMDLDSD